jgi:Uri superfamily endonuclease
MEPEGREPKTPGPESREPGIYTLLLHLNRSRDIKVGSLNALLFPEGYYSYTGSARGPGGLKRVARHLRVIEGVNASRRWHIDHLLPYTTLVEVLVFNTRENLECFIARRVGETLAPVKGFGCTDCNCVSHLHYSPELNRMKEAISSAYALCERLAAGQPVQTDVSKRAVGPKL